MAACPSCKAKNPARARFCLECGTPFAAAAAPPVTRRGSRRIVTVLFCDVVGSTALAEEVDAEAYWPIMAGYFDTMKPIIERHGGVVEKFIGDAIMAVFGLTVAREDDALRAVRAAEDMRHALVPFNEQLRAQRGIEIANRIGINTGEVLVPEGAGSALASGDAVNVAARLEQLAAAGEILVSEATLRLLRDAAETSPLRELQAKGKTEPVRAANLVSVKTQLANVVLSAGPLVGRTDELRALDEVLRTVVETSTPRLVSVVGTAGVGKSRLLAEFLGSLAGRASVLRGRCLSYGEGLTYWPIREIVFRKAAVAEADSPSDVVSKLQASLAGTTDSATIALTLSRAVGGGGPVSADDIAWAARRFFEACTADGPLVVLVEDVHWAQPTLLDLIEYLRDEAAGPILLICSSRPELIELRPDWSSDARSGSIVLDGLTEDAADTLLDLVRGDVSIPTDLRRRIIATAEGNPLFIEEMVRLLIERGGVAANSGEIPPTVNALMAARIDQLPDSERNVAEHSSVIGRVFEESAVLALEADDRRIGVANDLASLVRREIITREQAVEAAFKFRHVLIRDAAYQALPKTSRADLHQRFADWLEATVADRVAEYHELLGYHLSMAYGYQIDLRVTEATIAPLGRRAGAHLAAAGRAAVARGDTSAASALFTRAVSLPVESKASRADTLVRWAYAKEATGDIDGALELAERALVEAQGGADLAIGARAQLVRLELLEMRGEIVNPSPELLDAIDAAVADAQASGDSLAIAQALSQRAMTLYFDGRLDEADAEMRRGLVEAERSGDEAMRQSLELGVLVHELVGLSPATEVVTHANKLLADPRWNHYSRADTMRLLAIAQAMLEQREESRQTLAEGIRIVEDLRRPIDLSVMFSDASWVERLNGDLARAEQHLRDAMALIPGTDATSNMFLASRLAVVLVAQGRHEEALQLIESNAESPQLAARVRFVGAKARIDAARGLAEGARAGVEEILEAIKETSFTNVKTDILVDAAETMAALGKVDAARAHFRQAIDISDAKENKALANQLRRRLTDLAAH